MNTTPPMRPFARRACGSRSQSPEWTLLALAALGCASLPPPAPAPVTADPTRGRLRVTVTLGRELTLTRRAAGRLAVTWLSPDEARQRAAGALGLRPLIDTLSRFCVAGDVNLEVTGSAGVCTLEVPPGEYLPAAVLDGRGEFLETWLGGGGDGNLLGVAPAPVTVRAGTTVETSLSLGEVVHSTPPPEGCRGERTELLRVPAPATDGRVGNGSHRRLCVHLPADYTENSARRYPVAWLLPGLGGTDTSGFTRLLVSQRDAVARSTRRDAILIAVDTSTRLGSSYLHDSPITGAWESFITQEAVTAVDRAYRTIPEGRARALIGQSTGGFNAVSLAMRHPARFSVVAASAPDALDFEPWFLDESSHRVRPRWLGWMRLEDAMHGMGQWTSYAVDWSPDLSTPRGLRWPVSLETGAVIPEVWALWRARSPAVMLARPELREAVRAHLSGRIYLTAGRDDEADLFAPTARFSERLREAGIAHTFAPTDEGHFATPARARGLLSFALEALRAAE